MPVALSAPSCAIYEPGQTLGQKQPEKRADKDSGRLWLGEDTQAACKKTKSLYYTVKADLV